MFKLTLELIRTIETTLPFIFQLWEEEFILVRVSGGGCRVAGLAETITNSVKLKLKLRLSLAIFIREALKKLPIFGHCPKVGEGWGLKNHKLFIRNFVWTFFNGGGGFCHHAQTVQP